MLSGMGSSIGDRIKGWIGAHKRFSGLVGLVTFLVIVIQVVDWIAKGFNVVLRLPDVLQFLGEHPIVISLICLLICVRAFFYSAEQAKKHADKKAQEVIAASKASEVTALAAAKASEAACADELERRNTEVARATAQIAKAIGERMGAMEKTVETSLSVAEKARIKTDRGMAIMARMSELALLQVQIQNGMSEARAAANEVNQRRKEYDTPEARAHNMQHAGRMISMAAMQLGGVFRRGLLHALASVPTTPPPPSIDELNNWNEERWFEWAQNQAPLALDHIEKQCAALSAELSGMAAMKL